RHIRVKESARVSHVGANPPEFSSQMDDNVRPPDAIEQLDVRFDSQVTFAPAWNDQILSRQATLQQLFADGPSQKAGPARHANKVIRPVKHQNKLSVFRILSRLGAKSCVSAFQFRGFLAAIGGLIQLNQPLACAVTALLITRRDRISQTI